MSLNTTMLTLLVEKYPSPLFVRVSRGGIPFPLLRANIIIEWPLDEKVYLLIVFCFAVAF